MIRTTITAARRVERDGDTVRFECETDCEGGRLTERDPVPVILRFLNPRTFRFELQANPEVESNTTAPAVDLDRIAAPVDPTVSRANDRVVVETEALRVVVTLEPWSFSVEGLDGSPIFEEQPHDTDVRGNNRIDPLGFDEEEINHGPHRVVESGMAFEISPNERIYGLGEKFTGFDKVGQELVSWHVEPLGTETERAYKNIPFHLSTNGYGMLVDTTCRVDYDFGKSTTASGTVSVHDDTFAFVFFYGPSFPDILQEYTALTGRPSRPPKWSFGVWMSRLGYESSEQLEAITDRLRAEEIPCDVVHLDPFWMRERHACDLEWDTGQFPDPEGMIESLHAKDFRISLWEHPHVAVGTAAFETARDEGYLIEDGSGCAYVMDRTCQGDYRGAIVDFTNPEAVEWWQDKHRDLLAMGVDAFKTDYGEYVPEDAVFDDGRTGTVVHNLYPFLYNRTVFDVIEEENGAEEALVWARAAWTGSQRYPVHWGGDPQTTFNGMAAALRGGLSASLSGFGFWSHDIGGFRGDPSPELYVRWAQFGLLSSHARCHGTTPREPWAFGQRAVDIFRTYARERYRLLPYLYSWAEQTARTGIPTVRPLVLEFQDDPRAHQIHTQFLLGEALLVAPVFKAEGLVSVYLPNGEWIDYWTGDVYDGGQTIHLGVELETMPLFVRAGCILPTRDPTQSVQPGTPDSVTLETYLESTGASEATVPFYDDTADAVVDCRVRVDEPRTTIDVAFDRETATPQFRVKAEHVATPPERVTCNGETLAWVEEAPKQGEWTYEITEERVVAVV